MASDAGLLVFITNNTWSAVLFSGDAARPSKEIKNKVSVNAETNVGPTGDFPGNGEGIISVQSWFKIFFLALSCQRPVNGYPVADAQFCPAPVFGDAGV